MKIKIIICSALATALLTGCVVIQNGSEADHGQHCEHCGHHGKKWEHGEKGERAGQCEKDGPGEVKNQTPSQAQLMARTKITRAAAAQTALARVPGGTIKAGELERENGRLQWSFDTTAPGAQAVTEVNVDALTGEVISVQQESAADEAKEAGETGENGQHREHDGDND